MGGWGCGAGVSLEVQGFGDRGMQCSGTQVSGVGCAASRMREGESRYKDGASVLSVVDSVGRGDRGHRRGCDSDAVLLRRTQ